ncbi:spermidine/putrescine ABC transporter permease [Azospirillum sp. TSH7]|jgi:iron(III) transport system permease protein|uniref:ABC transporter permease n=1 Tax=unclassified Azospirillum TaxID=2630922 RepID=UPI000D60A198|nr:MULTISPECIES: iron ABC transporter permease [unclassified Azospirillum]PWC57344.1 spermidine/putrescine ABC transporter permease [Azospirillum sp. TSH7]PWC57637.1 spermidine/putrescine ABC transporter permease [Azospirillum sp. TSH20]QCG96010.1 iron ABC transporter permease [Azospirillum sp. TSA2s]
MNRATRIAVIVAMAIAVLAPIGLVVYQSFLDGPFFQPKISFTLSAYEFVLDDEDFFDALYNSCIIAFGMTAIAVPVGALLAFLMTRTDLPGRRWIEPVILVPMFVSSVVLAFGFVVSLGPAGFVTLWFKSTFGYVPWYLYSKWMLIVIAGLTHVPHIFLYTSSALRSLGSDVEEAARMTGAGPLRTAMTVSLPMVMPNILYSAVLVFFLGFELFGLPLVLGDPEGILVLATYLYKLTNKLGTPSYQLMAVVVVAIICIALPLVALQRFLLRAANRYVSVKGKAAAQKPVSIGVWRWPAAAMITAWLLFTVVVPLSGLVLRAFVSSWGEGVNLLDVLTLDHFRELMEFPNLTRGIVNTLLIASVGGALSVGVYTVLNLAAHRWPSGWTKLMDYLVLLPRAMPGLVAGLAIFWVFLFTPFLAPLRQTMIAIWVAYTLVWLAYGMRLVSGALLQIGPELEEAGRIVGASPGRVSRDLTIPLIKVGLFSSWLLIFVTFMREYSTGVYLLAPGTEVIGSLLVSLWGTGAVDLVTALSTINIAMIGGGLLLMSLFGKRSHG